MTPILNNLSGSSWKSLIGAAVFAALTNPAPLHAQADLSSLLAQGGGSTAEIPAIGSTGRVDLDAPTVILGQVGTMPVMSAPNDEAILVVHEGATLRLSNVILRKTGAEVFGVYVNGGALEIDNCRIEGGFDTAIYIASGSAVFRNCTVEGPMGSGLTAQPESQLIVMNAELNGASDVMIYADGAQVRMDRVSITDGGNNAIYMQNGAELRASDLRISGDNSSVMMALVGGVSARIQGLELSGNAGNGFLADSANEISLNDVTAYGDMAGAVIIDGVNSFSLEGFDLDTASGAIQISNMPGTASVSNGVITPRNGGYGIIVENASQTEISYTRVTGGEVGILLEQSLPDLHVYQSEFLDQTLYGLVMQDIPAADGAEGIRFENTTAAQRGESLAFFSKNAPPFDLINSRMAVAGSLLGYVENAQMGAAVDTVFTLAPVSEERTVVLTDLSGDRGRVFLADGFLDPVQGQPFLPDGIRVFSHTALTERSVDRDTQFAIADFALSGDMSGLSDILLEMDFTLLPDPPGPERFEVTLAPPADGIGWLPDALNITLTPPIGAPLYLRPLDFPVFLPQGLYQVSVEGIPADVLLIEGDTMLSVPEIPQPFMVSRDENGAAWRGPYLPLRAPNILAQISQGARPLRVSEYLDGTTYFIARGNADPALAQETVDMARARLPDIIALRDSLDFETENYRRGRLYDMQRMYFEVLAEFGTAEDAAWILDTFKGDSLYYNAVTAVVRLETRLGILHSGAVKAEINRIIAENDTSDQASWIIEGAARMGDPEALVALATQRTRLRDARAENALVNYGLATLSLAPPEITLPIYRDYLRRLDEIGAMYLDGAELDYSAAGHAEIWRNAGIAMAYIARHGTVDDRALFHVPVPGVGYSISLLPYVEDPAALLDIYLGGVPEADPNTRMWSWSDWFGNRVCLAVTLRDPAERAEIIDEMHSLTRAWYMEAFAQDYWERSEMDRRSLETSIAFGLGLSAAHCRQHPNVLETGSGGAEGEEERKFRYNNYDPDWWYRPVRARNQMQTLTVTDDWTRLDGLSIYDTDLLLGMLDELGGSPHADLIDIWERHHRLLTDAYVSPQWHTSFQSERRVFRLRNDGGNGSQSILGYVDMRPFPNDGYITIALRHSILSPDFGGLAAMIDEPNRTPYEVDHRIRMFETVTLDVAGEAVPMEYLETSEDGVHFFRAPFDGDLSNTYIRIGMRFVNTTWQLDYSLYDSHFAVDLRRLHSSNEEAE